MNRSTKVILTNRSALLRKHGRPGLTRIEGAIRRLVQADARRGFATRLVAIDSAADMKPFGRRVANRNDARQTKRAVDDVCRALQPEYVTILGAPDVVPHVRLRNPMAASRDEDRRIESDLPYACDKPYSTRIKDFLGPTRVVGRLPDIQGTGDTKHLLGLLEHARAWKSRPRSDYRDYFALSTASWRRSTATTTKKLFGEDGALRLSPSEGPYWTAGDLAGRIHVINCHGDTGAPRFFGEAEDDEYDQPSCHESVLLPGRVAPATVVAAECCYGAELYKPQKGKPAGICHAYLGEGAEAFFGSTTIAYGPSSGNNFADLICGHFLRRVLEGASVGRAALEARQEYIRLGGYMEMVDLKTVAQFILLGDPSIHPVLAAGTTSWARHRPEGQGRARGGSPSGSAQATGPEREAPGPDHGLRRVPTGCQGNGGDSGPARQVGAKAWRTSREGRELPASRSRAAGPSQAGATSRRREGRVPPGGAGGQAALVRAEARRGPEACPRVVALPSPVASWSCVRSTTDSRRSPRRSGTSRMSLPE